MQCKLCKSMSLDEIDLDKGLYYHCPECDLIFIDESEIICFEEEFKRYSEHDNNHQNKGYVKMFNKFIEEVIKPYQSEINTALDFGCGPGPVLADLLMDLGFDQDIYDLHFFPDEVYKNKKYDLITSTEVFEHFKEPRLVIEKLVNHLNHKGYLAVMTSFHPGTKDFKDWWYKWDPTHITFYNTNTFAWIAEEFSLEMIFEDGNKYCLFRKK